MATKVASVVVAGLSTTTRYVDKFLVECYTNSGLTNLVTTKFVGAVYDSVSGNNLQKGIIVFKGLTYGQTYYFRAGVVAPITGSTAWSATFSIVAGSATGPSAVTYTGNYEATTSGVALQLTPASVPSDIDHYEFIWTYDGSVPAASAQPYATSAPAATLNFFAGGKPNDRVTSYVRAVNTSHQQQTWTLLGTVGIALVKNDAIVHQGTSPGGASNYSYRQFSSAAYTIASGDRLEYDVYMEVGDPEYKGGVDFHYTTGGGGRFTGSVINDQNGVSNAVATDLTARTKGRWYHREFDLTSLAGKAIDTWAVFLEGDAAGSYKGQFANIRVMNGSTVQLQVFGTGAVSSTTVWASGPGETYTSVQVHTAQTSVGSINTAQIVDQAVVGTKAALTASARDVNMNLFGDNVFGSSSGTQVTAFSSISAAMSTNVEKWYYYQDGSTPTDTPDFRNNGEIRIPKVTATGGTKVVLGQFKKWTRFYSGLNYAVRIWVRINAGDATPNGNFNICFRAYDSNGNLVSTIATNSNAGSGISSVAALGLAYWQPFNIVAGAQYYAVEFENTSTNTDIWVTGPMLNRGTQVSEYTEQTYLTDVKQAAYEGYAFVQDGFTGSNGTLLNNHYPDVSGFEWIIKATPGGSVFDIQNNKLQLEPGTATSSDIYYYNNRNPLTPAYYVQADCMLSNVALNKGNIGVIARGQANLYKAVLTNRSSTSVDLQKVVSASSSVVASSPQTLVANTFYNIRLLVYTGGQKVYFNGNYVTPVITSTDTSVTYVSTECVGVQGNFGSDTTIHHQIDNFIAVYMQNSSTPSNPPAGGGGAGDPGGGGSCVVGNTWISTRSGDQMMADLWQKFVTDEWTTADDIMTYNFTTGQWEFYKPTKLWCSGVKRTYAALFSNAKMVESSEDHRYFTQLSPDETLLRRADEAVVDSDAFWSVEDNTQVGLAHMERKEEDAVVFRIEIPPNCNYVTNGILSHNLKVP